MKKEIIGRRREMTLFGEELVALNDIIRRKLKNGIGLAKEEKMQ